LSAQAGSFNLELMLVPVFKFKKQFYQFTAATFLLIISVVYAFDAAPVYTVNTQVYFSPMGGAAAAIIREIEQAKKEIKVQAFLFTYKDIVRALVNAKRRGIDVELILDASNRTDQHSAANFISDKKITTYIDAQHSTAHNKVMIIDCETVITGSFNFTKSAEEKNAENLLIMRSKELANTYLINWDEHRRHSEIYK
jgi:phosphatidylserine/phosphatidylglycerophosphate/cardiolipin synthase-like enzyme